MSKPSKSPDEFLEVIGDVLRQMGSSEPSSDSWGRLRIGQVSPGVEEHQARDETLRTALARMAQERPLDARLLRLRFEEGAPAIAVASELGLVEGSVYNRQARAIRELSELLWRREVELRHERRVEVLGRLELPTYTRLFGIDESLERLYEWETSRQPPWILALEALGGTGKTALVDHLCRLLIADGSGTEILWVTARHAGSYPGRRGPDAPVLTPAGLVQHLSAQLALGGTNSSLSLEQKQRLLIARLKANRHLVVVDNLETQQDIRALLPIMRQLTNPSRILITARASLFNETDLFHFRLAELKRSDALSLLRHHAQESNLPEVVSAEDEELEPLFQAVGGNPLALRLLIGLLHVSEMSVVLRSLREAEGVRIGELYRFIYGRAWESLDEVGRRVLLLMPLIADGGADFDTMVQMSGISSADLHDGLARLVRRNLVDSRGDLQHRRYSIHSLTRTFLHKQVLRWGAEAEGVED